MRTSIGINWKSPITNSNNWYHQIADMFVTNTIEVTAIIVGGSRSATSPHPESEIGVVKCRSWLLIVTLSSGPSFFYAGNKKTIMSLKYLSNSPAQKSVAKNLYEIQKSK